MPYPVLAGAITGIASLIPVVGMKIVYVPLAAAASVPIALSGDTSLLVSVGAFLVVSIVVVDTIPDLLLRPYLSGERTHVELGLTFADTTLPRLLGAEPEDRISGDQLRPTDF